jgi:predicted acetyltransferase
VIEVPLVSEGSSTDCHGPILRARVATVADVPLLAEMNRQLIQDEGHRNRMGLPELAERMRAWLEEDYAAILFEQDGAPVAYALFRNEDEADAIYLRHFFVARPHRRAGIGRRAMQTLLDDFWPPGRRVRVEVLCANTGGLAFWKAVGLAEYALTLEMERPDPSSS